MINTRVRQRFIDSHTGGDADRVRREQAWREEWVIEGFPGFRTQLNAKLEDAKAGWSDVVICPAVPASYMGGESLALEATRYALDAECMAAGGSIAMAVTCGNASAYRTGTTRRRPSLSSRTR